MARDTDFKKYATQYNPITIGSIDGTDTEPHDRGILRAIYSEYTPNKSVRGDPRHTLFIGRLNPRTTQETLQTEFSKFGRIVYCRLVKDIVTGKSKQYGFIEFESINCMEKAHREMHKEYIDGYEILVEREAERMLKGWKPRRLGGGFGGRKESGQLRFGCRERPFIKPIVINRQNRDYQCHRRSFTRTEVLLVIIEALLLVLFVLSAVFLILHMLVCGNIRKDHRDSSHHSHKPEAVSTELERSVFSPTVYTNRTITSRIPKRPDNVTYNSDETFHVTGTPILSDNDIDNTDEMFDVTPRISKLPDSVEDNPDDAFDITPKITMSPIISGKVTNDKRETLECTWGEATEASTHYYHTPTDLDEKRFNETRSHGVRQLILAEMSDGTKETDYRGSILALVKVDPYAFGCTLSVISERWAVTAANCVTSIQEQDNLESYLMLDSTENRSHSDTRNHTVSSVKRHPSFEKGQPDYDIVALKSVDKLLDDGMKPLGLPLMLDYLMITFGETLTILGFGAFRKSSSNSSDGALRRALVHKLPPNACQGASALRRVRHLMPVSAGAAVRSPPPLCAGVVATTTAPCAYCAGSPLVVDGNLVGVMAARPDCALSCRPALYVNVAAIKQWLQFLIATE